MSTSNDVMLTMTYEDATTRNITFKNVPNSNLGGVKNKVKAINSNMSTNFKGTFISENGSPVLKIGKAQVIQTTEEVIYSD